MDYKQAFELVAEAVRVRRYEAALRADAAKSASDYSPADMDKAIACGLETARYTALREVGDVISMLVETLARGEGK